MKRAVAPFLVGFISIQVQTLLLREYIVLFGGSELSIGLFMGGWFLWISLAAMLFARFPAVKRLCGQSLWPLLALWPLVVPIGAPFLRILRSFAHISAYEPVPPDVLLIAALSITALGSSLTGILFPAAAGEGAGRDGDPAQPAVNAYWLEGLGAGVGGVAVTLMLFLSMNIFHITAVIDGAAIAGVFWHLYRNKPRFSRRLWVVIPALAVVSLSIWGSKLNRWSAAGQLRAGTKGLRFVRRLETPYRVLTLARAGDERVVLSDGEILLSIPFSLKEKGVAALLKTITQGHNFLALGLGGLRMLPVLDYPGTELTVVSPDKRAFDAIRPMLGKRRGLHYVGLDPRLYVATTKQRFDAVLISGGEPATLKANRLYTTGAFALIHRVLSPDGVLAVPAHIPENFVGPYFREYGNAILGSLKGVFKHTGIVSGGGGLLLGSDRVLDLVPAHVITSYKSLIKQPFFFNPARFYGLLKPERSEYLKQVYDNGPVIINTDTRPLAFYLKLLTLLRLNNANNAVTLLDRFRRHAVGVLVTIFAVVLLFLLLGRYRFDSQRPYGVTFAMSVMGAMGMGAMILLFTAYQTVAGTLMRDLGLASGLFMVGIVAGAGLMRKISAQKWVVLYPVLAGVVLAGMTFLLPTALNPYSRVVFLVFFCVAGLLTGGIWPLIAGMVPSEVAATLEWSDHLGAVFGALGVGLLLLPSLGLHRTGLALVGLGLSGSLAIAVGKLPDFDNKTLNLLIKNGTHPWKRPAFILMFAGVLLVALLPLLRPLPVLKKTLTKQELRGMEDFNKAVSVKSPFLHYRLEGVKQTDQGVVVVVSAVVAPDIKGFAGPINLAISVNNKGIIRRIRVIQSRETPAYVAGFSRFLQQFKGRSIDVNFILGHTPGIDAMTGATITSRAATRIINAVDQALSVRLFHHQARRQAKSGLHIDSETIYVVVLFVLGLLVHYYAGSMVRLLFLFFVVTMGGFVLNVSLSAAWLQDLLRLTLPPVSNLHMFLLTLFVLISTLLLGPLWCAHLCPFGALQELVSRFGNRLKLLKNPAERIEKVMRGTRYIMLLLVVLTLYGSNPDEVAGIDPLSTVFSGHLFGIALVFSLLITLGALFNFRFFCRNLCPVGAFLALIGRVQAWFGLNPARNFHRCDLGVKGPWDGDCLQCNRCIRELHKGEK